MRGARRGTTAHSIAKNTSDRTPATVAVVLFVTRSKTSHTTPDVVSASEDQPGPRRPVRGRTSQGRSPCRNSTRWNATGAVISPVAITEPAEHRQVGQPLDGVQVREPVAERQREQEAGQDLDAGLGDPQLLEQLVEVAGQPLGLGLVLERRVEGRS